MSYAKKYGSRYNFDRVMHDHRYVPDVHVKSHVPFTTVNYFNVLPPARRDSSTRPSSHSRGTRSWSSES